MWYFLQQILNGVHVSAIYAVLAFGYTLTHGVLHRTNLAFGGLFAFAGQMMILIAVFGWQVLWLTLPATVALGIVGALALTLSAAGMISRSVLKPLAGRSPNAIVAATLGVLIILTELCRIAADTKDFWLPPMLATPVELLATDRFALTLTVIQMVNIGIMATFLGLGAWILAATRFGRLWRAVFDDPLAASMCGVDTGRVFTFSVLAGGFAAALAGILAALHYGNIGFGAGLVFGLKVLFITAVGGYDSPSRSAAGAAAFGMTEALWSGYFSIEWRDAAMFAMLVALLVLTRADDDRTPLR